MTITSDLLQCHVETLVADNTQWQTVIADDVVWEPSYAAAIDHPSRLSGRDEVARHGRWFVGSVETFRFFDVRLHPYVDADATVAEVNAENVIKAMGQSYRQEYYVVFLRAAAGKTASLREYF